MLSSEAHHSINSEQTPTSPTLSAAMEDIAETLDPDAVLESVEVLDSEEIFAQNIMTESCVAGLDSELALLQQIKQDSSSPTSHSSSDSSNSSNQRFVDEMRNLCAKYELDLEAIYKG
jgi:hypothetical protein